METLDIITSIDLIEAVEKSPYFGSLDFLKKTLGEDTLKKMIGYGYLTVGFCIENNKLKHTYGVTDLYKFYRSRIREQRRNCIFNFFQLKFKSILNYF